MATDNITGTESILDSRDIESRIEELAQEILDYLESEHDTDQNGKQDEFEDEQRDKQADHDLAQLELPEAERVAFEPDKYDREDFDPDVFDLDSVSGVREFIENYPNDAKYMQEEVDELLLCLEFREELAGYTPDWRYGATLISDDYFVDYCKELLQDCGGLPRNLPDYLVIDWEATAENLAVDYTTADINGTTWYVR